LCVDAPIDILQRMENAVGVARHRLAIAVRSLESRVIPYAIAGGNAAAAWIATVDPGAVRGAPNVSLLIRRSDLSTARSALEAVGFTCARESDADLFLAGPNPRDRHGTRLLFAGECVGTMGHVATPLVTDSSKIDGRCVLTLDALTCLALIWFELDNRVDLLDLIGVGLIDSTWPARLPSALAARLRPLLDNPER
jgi:hypothetical protein